MKSIKPIVLTQDKQFIETPMKGKKSAPVVNVTYNGSMPVLWFEWFGTTQNEVREFHTVETGKSVKDTAKYIGSVGNDLRLVHVFEV